MGREKEKERVGMIKHGGRRKTRSCSKVSRVETSIISFDPPRDESNSDIRSVFTAETVNSRVERREGARIQRSVAEEGGKLSIQLANIMLVSVE